MTISCIRLCKATPLSPLCWRPAAVQTHGSLLRTIFHPQIFVKHMILTVATITDSSAFSSMRSPAPLPSVWCVCWRCSGGACWLRWPCMSLHLALRLYLWLREFYCILSAEVMLLTLRRRDWYCNCYLCMQDIFGECRCLHDATTLTRNATYYYYLLKILNKTKPILVLILI